MQLFTIALLALSAASVRAGCYSGGTTGTKSAVLGSLSNLCVGLKGHYIKNEERYQCVTDTNNQKWNFTLKVRSLDRTLYFYLLI